MIDITALVGSRLQRVKLTKSYVISLSCQKIKNYTGVIFVVVKPKLR